MMLNRNGRPNTRRRYEPWYGGPAPGKAQTSPTAASTAFVNRAATDGSDAA